MGGFRCWAGQTTRVEGWTGRPFPPRLECLYSPSSGNRLWRYTGCGISVADPGAVPGASTRFTGPREGPAHGGEPGSTRVVKTVTVARHGSAVIGPLRSCER